MKYTQYIVFIVIIFIVIFGIYVLRFRSQSDQESFEGVQSNTHSYQNTCRNDGETILIGFNEEDEVCCPGLYAVVETRSYVRCMLPESNIDTIPRAFGKESPL